MLADLEVIQTVNWRGSARFEREMLTLFRCQDRDGRFMVETTAWEEERKNGG